MQVGAGSHLVQGFWAQLAAIISKRMYLHGHGLRRQQRLDSVEPGRKPGTLAVH